CTSDSKACACCLIEQRLHRLETIVNKTLQKLTDDVTSINATLNFINGCNFAFSASFTGCSGPHTVNKTIVYENTFLNYGDAYDTSTGIFTAPKKGVYSFTFTVQVDISFSTTYTKLFTVLEKTGVPIVMTKDTSNIDQDDSSTNSAILHLEPGDTVQVKLVAGSKICGDKNNYNTFSGFLVFPLN
uniref:Cerebellin 20 n=1 Tax=Latimeria chalumnae TaxID=7897 RepID=H3BHD2_LATCH